MKPRDAAPCIGPQSMVASKYVRPFAEEVHSWEQRLSMVGETIEVGGPAAYLLLLPWPQRLGYCDPGFGLPWTQALPRARPACH